MFYAKKVTKLPDLTVPIEESGNLRGSLVVSMSNARTMQSGLSMRSSRFTTSGSSDAPLKKDFLKVNQSSKPEVTSVSDPDSVRSADPNPDPDSEGRK